MYRTAYTMFADAVSDELIDANPCKLKRSELPKKRDKDPEWRAKAIFTRDEVETIIADDEMDEDRRVLNSLLVLTGMRFGEVAALRWSAYDPVLKPLGMLSVHTSYDLKRKKDKGVKTDTPRRVPVHPLLAAILANWKLRGWEEFTGRQPKPDDLVFPNRRGKPRDSRVSLRQFHRDLDRLGLRKRRQYDLRRTFITLCLTDGARKDVLRWVTHGPEGDIIDVYTTLPWEALCAEVAKLKIARREGKVIALPLAAMAGGSGNRTGDLLPLTTVQQNASTSRKKMAEAHGNRTRRAAARAEHHRL